MLNEDKRIRLVLGHAGSGKTEFSVNYAMKLAKMGKKTAIVDLDVVNLYFRSREAEDLLKDHGIELIGSSVKANAVDTPAISAEVFRPLNDDSYDVVFDIGGSVNGARVLGQFHEYTTSDNTDAFLVVNANRPETRTAEDAYQVIKQIEAAARIKLTGLVNATHLLMDTSEEDVAKGDKVVRELSKMLDIPVKYICVLESVAKNLEKDKYLGEIFPIKLYVRDGWMDN